VYRDLAQPEENMFCRRELRQLAVQLEKDVLGDLFSRRPIAHHPQRDAEDHRLVLEHQLVKRFRSPDQVAPVSPRTTGFGKGLQWQFDGREGNLFSICAPVFALHLPIRCAAAERMQKLPHESQRLLRAAHLG
jgi:hypothetical protein